MNLISLLRYQYSKYCFKELALMILTGFIMVTLLESVAPILYVFSMAELTKSALPATTLYFYPSTRISNMLLTSITATNDIESISSYIDQVHRDRGVAGIGKTAEWSVGGSDTDAQATHYVAYNEDMVRFASVPLQDGQWLDASVPAGFIPIIVGGAYRDQKKVDVGDTLQLSILWGDTHCMCEGYVVGILNSDDMYLRLSYGATNPGLESIAVQYQWADNTEKNQSAPIIILPASALKEYVDIQYTPGSLLFFEHQADYEAMGTGEKYGTYATHTDMLASQLKITLLIHNSDLAATIALTLFATIGLGGYSMLTVIQQKRTMSIYRVCGMSKRNGMLLQLASTFMLVLIPAAVSLSQVPNRLGNFAKLDGTFYAIYSLLLVLILLPSVVFIIANDHSRYIVQKEDM